MAQWLSPPPTCAQTALGSIPRTAREATEPCLGELGVQRKAKPQNMVLWPCGSVALWPVTLWPCGPVALWPVALWPVQSSVGDPSCFTRILLGLQCCALSPSPPFLSASLVYETCQVTFEVSASSFRKPCGLFCPAPEVWPCAYIPLITKATIVSVCLALMPAPSFPTSRGIP